MRKLVTVRTIESIEPIEGADAIELAVVDGWKCVVQKGLHKPQTNVLYFEIDSFLPQSDGRFESFMKSTRTFEGVVGHKVRTIKLRGQISQGVLMPLGEFPEILGLLMEKMGETLKITNKDYDLLHGIDVSELLGIVKWEPPVSGSVGGNAKGNFPSFLQKTDQERHQNLKKDIFYKNVDSKYEVSMKLDGTSCTYFHNRGEVGVCSRNLQLQIDDANIESNALVKVFVTSGIDKVLEQCGRNIALQGELMGPGIQGNRENLKALTFFLFDIYDIDTGYHMPSAERIKLFNELPINNRAMIQHAPILATDVTLTDLGIFNTQDLIDFAEGQSINHKIREGVVFKRMDGKFSFKSISNTFLAKEKD